MDEYKEVNQQENIYSASDKMIEEGRISWYPADLSVLLFCTGRP